MKIREGFVSNSSSSSFIVMDNSKKYDFKFINSKLDDHGLLIIDNSFGETDFGWGPEVIQDGGSRVIFAYLQAIKPKWLKMLENLIKGCTYTRKIKWDIDGYVDHQSSAQEGVNTEIFEDEKILKVFFVWTKL